MINNLTGRVNNLTGMVKRVLRIGKVTGPLQEGNSFPLQQVQVLGKGGNAIIYFGYGEHANVPADDDEIQLVFTYAGGAENRISMPTSWLKRPKDLAPGEKVSFNPETGSEVRYKANGDIELTGPNFKVIGNLKVTGDTALGATVTSNGINISDTHTHAGSATAPTGAVSPTGTPVP